MTKFDPKFALAVMKRRQSEKNKAAAEIHLEKFILQMGGRIGHFGAAADEFDKEIHALWAQADSYDSVLAYLDGRIWESKTRAEKIWATIQDWGYDPSNFGLQMVNDVLEAADLVDNGLKSF